MSAPTRQKHLVPDDTMELLRSVDSVERKISVARNNDRSGVKISFIIFFVATVYATIRYNVIKGVAWSDWPLYTLNKVFGVTSLLLLVVAVIRYRLGPLYSNAKILYMAGLFAGIHILISFMLLNPVYFQKFFLDNKLTAVASISMLLGSIATVIFISGAASKSDRNVDDKIRSLVVVCVLTGLHTFFQGFQSWLVFSTWPGFFPPITLISFVASITAVILMIYPKRIR
jgi:hypothetical protein